ncbi:hypothetical protein FRC14_005322 [Serendipita sp. 396]|nr:hypothetical protein FRC14_005322 [Serendipita sp. 396]KAG8773201.1 hypothetical protein FRC15_002205 [Serendipita sp. 397]KAG8818265.1 hypothetical protein FRC18_000169 [Serendipita sp. 400]KAG8824238.1 hypothetical protein FRC19_002183 [Serendipita sp. 401]KAG8847068.1 hypothetical protein FRB91_000235 [Serendipita sp. 411]KAG8862712.1 hypothetical protein FRC20_011059 [Serendipita sp. 405]KAG9055435.1 hypothetical protein FS842_002209 [Serendipita sp. 407]
MPPYITPAPVPATFVPHAAHRMTSKDQLAGLAQAMGRSLSQAVTFDPASQTYGCRISEQRATAQGVFLYALSEVYGQPDRNTAEQIASAQAMHVLSNEISNVAIAVLR